MTILANIRLWLRLHRATSAAADGLPSGLSLAPCTDERAQQVREARQVNHAQDAAPWTEDIERHNRMIDEAYRSRQAELVAAGQTPSQAMVNASWEAGTYVKLSVEDGQKVMDAKAVKDASLAHHQRVFRESVEAFEHGTPMPPRAPYRLEAPMPNLPVIEPTRHAGEGEDGQCAPDRHIWRRDPLTGDLACTVCPFVLASETLTADAPRRPAPVHEHHYLFNHASGLFECNCGDWTVTP